MDSEKIIKVEELTDDSKLIDIAKSLDEYEDSQVQKLCKTLNNEKLAMILEQADEDSQIRITDFLTNSKILSVFKYIQKDDIVDILGILKVGRTKELMNLMKSGDRAIIKQLLGYRDDCAGGIMTTEYIALSGQLTIKEAFEKLKIISPKTEFIDTFFVTNVNKKLIGTIDIRTMLSSDENEVLNNIADKNFKYVEPEVDQEEVALMASKYDLTVIPVLNKNKGLLGIITIDDIIDVMEEEQTEDVLKMGGVAKEENLNTTLLESVKLRFPWLFINLITAFLAALTVKSFENIISQVVALSSIMSIVTGMGGNAGTQTVSIIIRNIAMGKVELKDAWHLIGKEILLGIIDGAGIGIITAGVVYLIYGNVYLGLIIFLAMIGNLVVAGFSGLLIPLILDKLHIDPALSSSIFLTTATDVLGFFIFLSLAKLFLLFLV